MSQIAIIGAGVSGLTVAKLLSMEDKITVFEKTDHPGGLIHCKRINGSLFHTCGGHVFNTKNQMVINWFWKLFNQKTEFVNTDRNSVIILPNGQFIPYPIENFVYLLDKQIQKNIISDLFEIKIQSTSCENTSLSNFQAFLQRRFGNTLYCLYFEPYNRKVWGRPLSDIPIEWLEGKLPMPNVEEIVFNNFNRVAEKQFVHSSFYYEKNNGSQFIADRLAEGLNIKYNTEVKEITREGKLWIIDRQPFDQVVFCGNLKDLPTIVKGIDLFSSSYKYSQDIDALLYHGTTSVFCEIDHNPYSWIYLPDGSYHAHRIICTGNFAKSNNTLKRLSATVEFTDRIDKDSIIKDLDLIPFHPTYITHQYNPCTYPIQNSSTKGMVSDLKNELEKENFYLTGRFADWEYYNVDVAISAAMNTVNRIVKSHIL